MNAIEIIQADATARRGFSYQEDPAKWDNWRSHADEALSGRPWQGDCDDLASTFLDILCRRGAALDQLYRLIVSSTRSATPDHMIAGVRADDGVFWIGGDTFGPAYRAATMQHRPIYFNRLSEAGRFPVWRKLTPWEADEAAAEAVAETVPAA